MEYLLSSATVHETYLSYFFSKKRHLFFQGISKVNYNFQSQNAKYNVDKTYRFLNLNTI